MKPYGNRPCVYCKGFHAKPSYDKDFCPLVDRFKAMFKMKDFLGKENFVSSSQIPFVGRYGYPRINVGILNPPEQGDTSHYDAPRYWSEQDFDLNRLVEIRSSLVNSRFNVHIKDKHRFLEISQEVGMASKPVDLEVNLNKKPKFRLNVSPVASPFGANASLKKIKVTSNPKISQRVDKVVSDTDLKADEGIMYLYKHEFDENFLSKVMSVGVLGIKKNRKLVPTRWSITATDDTIGKNLIKKVKDFPEYDYFAYFGGYLGNYYLILFFPEPWSYELFETYAPSWHSMDKVNTASDYESYEGRKTYAVNTVGGYYAARLAILERLNKVKRQGTVLTLRFITEDYAVPLGVWVVREATRKSMSSKPIGFSSKELMLNYAKLLIKKKFNFNLDYLLEKSIVIKNLKSQTKLRNFF